MRFSVERGLRGFLSILVLCLAGVALDSHAFVRSEDELLRSEVEEARARAKGFQKYLEKRKRERAELERAVQEARERRQREEKEQSAIRAEYADKKRRRELKETEELARLERLFEKSLEDRERQFEKARKDYLRKRDRVNATIEREGSIDERLEYEL